MCVWCGHLVKLQAPNLDLVRDDHFLLSRSMITTCGFCSHRDQRQVPAIKVIIQSRDQRVAVFNFGTDRVRVLEKTSGSGSGTDRVRVLALHFYQSGIIGY